MESVQQRKLLSGLCHGAIFFSSTIVTVAIPIVILYITEDSVVKANARESLNFHINLYIYGLIAGVLTIVLIGIPLLMILGVISIVMPIIALIQVLNSPDQPYRYPFIFRLV
ncbi:DUF4870 domain-containing protein [Rivularia sp. UHCC 0363]|uniref:DUF4870 domain-containing protein n=1 Tax=Rivularia sp. UHCC 0363 TaxID=3110244 RepID=UPI002B20DCC4|nr:DUF4870 domain-containing protein [Rivularia sp. UHCC 0363]MEA5595213.1 DUF4870 domain-containing protein [Rivularia sp. UHCC 0363]